MRTTLSYKKSYKKLFYRNSYAENYKFATRKVSAILFNIKLLCLLIMPMQAAKQLLPTFSSAPIGQHATYFMPSYAGAAALYVGANNATPNNDYALAVSRTGANFTALAPAKVNLNNSPDSINPINGAKIDVLGLANDLPAVVLDGQKKIYLVYNIINAPNLVSILSSPDLNDSTGAAITNSILKITGTKIMGSNYLFAVVQNNAGDAFGAPGSGISLLKQTGTPNSQSKKINYKLSVLNNNTAVSLTGATPQVFITNPAIIASNLVDLYWNNDLNCLYTAISVQANAAAGSGARAVVIGKVINNQLQFVSIAPDSVFNGINTGIVGTGQNSAVVSIQKIRSMTTSTCLNYLIVAGGNNTAANTGNLIYALPLVNSNNLNTNGTLAKYDSVPTIITVGGSFRSRAYTVPAVNPGDILANNNPAATVGAGNLPMPANSQVTDLFVIDDTVFASINDAYAANVQPGLFYSQALFDNLGRIQGWTPWQRASGTDAQMLGAGPIPKTGDFWYIPNNTTAFKTIWGTGAEDGLLGGTISDASLGLIDYIDWPIQNVANYAPNTADLNNGLDNLALLIATGNSIVSLVETGRNSGFNSCKPNTGDFATNAQINNNGILPALDPTSKIATIANGDLAKIGPITTSVIATNTITNQHWIIVGGSNGIAVLCDNTGACWTGNLTQLSDLNLTPNLAFKQVGNYQFVQKLLCDGTYLYVLTNGKLDRILLSVGIFATNTLNPITLIQSNVNVANANSFFDLAISPPLALLATSQGLLRTGNGVDISNPATDQTNVDWTTVTIPQAIGPVYQLSPLSPTTNLQDFVNGGNLYVLSAYRGYLQAQINRFTVNLTGGVVNNNTVQPLPDQHLANQLSYFINFYEFKDAFNYLSGSMYATHALDNDLPLTLQKMPNNIKSGNRFFLYKNDIFTESINPGVIPTQINPTIISSASGALLTSGNFGLRVDE